MNFAQAVIRTFSRKERIAAIAALVVFFLSGAAKAGAVIEERSVMMPAPGGTYREGIVGQPVAVNPVISGNPADEALAALVYARLGTLVEDLTVTEERVYTLLLKEGLVWADGTPLTSDDVLFTVETIQNPEAQSPRYKNWEGVVAERVSELRLTLTLSSPYVFFEEQIRNLLVVPRHLFVHLPPSNIRLSAYNFEPVGSGPYRFEGLTKRRDGFITEYHFVRNELFAGEPAFIKHFFVKFFESPEELRDAYRRRAIDGFGAFAPDKDETIRGERIYAPTAAYYAVFFNPRAKTLLAEESFRRALVQAIDRETLVTDVLGGAGTPVAGPDPYRRDAGTPEFEKASSTLAKLRAEYGELKMEIAVPETPFLRDAAVRVKEMWEAAGISEVRLVFIDEATFMNRIVRERNYEAVLFGNVLEHEYDLFPFWHTSERFYPGLNLALFTMKSLDTVLEDIRQEADADARRELFEKAVDIIADESPAVFLFTVPYTYVHNGRLHGFALEKPLVVPADRFRDAASWYVNEARVIE